MRNLTRFIAVFLSLALGGETVTAVPLHLKAVLHTSPSRLHEYQALSVAAISTRQTLLRSSAAKVYVNRIASTSLYSITPVLALGSFFSGIHLYQDEIGIMVFVYALIPSLAFSAGSVWFVKFVIQDWFQLHQGEKIKDELGDPVPHWKAADSQLLERLSRLDRHLLNLILTGKGDIHSRLFQLYPEKIYIHWREENNVKNGRTIYLALEKPIHIKHRTYTHLRLKGVRPHVQDLPSGESMPIHMGIGRIESTVMPADDGSFMIVKGRQDPQGSMPASNAEHEYRVMVNLSQLDEPVVDMPVGWGTYPELTFEGAPVGWVVAAMETQDTRLGRQHLLESEILSVLRPRHRLSYEKPSLSPQQSLAVIRSLGRALKTFHQAGYTHRFLTFGNIGVVVPDNESWDPRAVIRDLDSGVTWSDWKGSSGYATRRETAWKFIDFMVVIRALSQSPFAIGLLEEFLEGYFPGMSPTELHEWEQRIVMPGFSEEYLRLFGEYDRQVAVDTVQIDAQHFTYGFLWKALEQTSRAAQGRGIGPMAMVHGLTEAARDFVNLFENLIYAASVHEMTTKTHRIRRLLQLRLPQEEDEQLRYTDAILEVAWDFMRRSGVEFALKDEKSFTRELKGATQAVVQQQAKLFANEHRMIFGGRGWRYGGLVRRRYLRRQFERFADSALGNFHEYYLYSLLRAGATGKPNDYVRSETNRMFREAFYTAHGQYDLSAFERYGPLAMAGESDTLRNQLFRALNRGASVVVQHTILGRGRAVRLRGNKLDMVILGNVSKTLDLDKAAEKLRLISITEKSVSVDASRTASASENRRSVQPPPEVSIPLAGRDLVGASFLQLLPSSDLSAAQTPHADFIDTLKREFVSRKRDLDEATFDASLKRVTIEMIVASLFLRLSKAKTTETLTELEVYAILPFGNGSISLILKDFVRRQILSRDASRRYRVSGPDGFNHLSDIAKGKRRTEMGRKTHKHETPYVDRETLADIRQTTEVGLRTLQVGIGFLSMGDSGEAQKQWKQAVSTFKRAIEIAAASPLFSIEAQTFLGIGHFLMMNHTGAEQIWGEGLKTAEEGYPRMGGVHRDRLLNLKEDLNLLLHSPLPDKLRHIGTSVRARLGHGQTQNASSILIHYFRTTAARAA